MQKIQKDKADVLRVIREKQPELAGRFTVRRIGVFGSFARDSASAGSDVDILVELAEPTLTTTGPEVLFGGGPESASDLVLADTENPASDRLLQRRSFMPRTMVLPILLQRNSFSPCSNPFSHLPALLVGRG
jgi:hypothetical protein